MTMIGSFPANDPRATLTASADVPKPTTFGPAEYVLFHEEKPAVADSTQKTWYARGNNFYFSYSDAEPGAVLKREGQPDESILLVPSRSTRAEVTVNGTKQIVEGHTISILAPGDAEVRVIEGGPVVRLFTTAGPVPTDYVINEGSYREPKPNVAPLRPWPGPKVPTDIRTYSLDVEKEEGRFGRMFRCSTFLVNWIEGYDGERDPRKMSPHHHDDFEQCSFALEGEFEHHIRWPWISDSTQWREDEHTWVPSPSIAVIPPPAVHTTRGTGAGHNQMIDVFCPPREDFAAKPGWILNAEDYPMIGQE
jgi:hypothetical protein